MSEPFLTLPGIKCWCGSAELRCVEPGNEAEQSTATGILTRRPAALRGFCCVAHATGRLL